MKKIIGYDTKVSKPGIPSFLESSLGGITKEGSRLDSTNFKPIKPFDLPEGHWAGITWDGNVEPYLLAEEDKWKMRAAFEAVKNSKSLDPESSIKMLKSAASMVGIDVETLVGELKSFAMENESLVDVFHRKNRDRK